MGRKIVFFGNCLAQFLADFYVEHLSHDDDIKTVGAAMQSPEKTAALAQADIIVEQIFDDGYDLRAEGASASSLRVRFPTILGAYFWPFATEQHVHNAHHYFAPEGEWRSEWSDSYLNRKIRDGVPTEQALREYLALDMAKVASLDRLREIHLERQSERDAIAGIETRSTIEARFRWEQQFHDLTHPCRHLFAILAEGVYSKLGFSKSMIEHALARMPEAPLSGGWSSIPVHPRLIEHYKLEWVAPDQVYLDPYWGPMTFERWARRYMEHDWNSDIFEGIHLAGRGDDTAALPLLERGLVRSPKALHGLHAVAEIYRRADRLEEAENVLVRAAEINTVTRKTLVALGQIQRLRGKIADFEATWRQGIERFPTVFNVFFELASSLREQRRNSEADELQAQGVLLVRPKYAEIYQANGHFLRDKGDLVGAAQAIRSALALRPSDRTLHLDLAEVLGRATDTRAEAIAILCRLTACGSYDFAAFVLLGDLAAQAGDLALSEHGLRGALALKPNNCDVLVALTRLLTRMGRAAEINRLSERYADAGGTMADIHAALGRQAMRDGALNDARVSFQTALALEPGHAGAAAGVIKLDETIHAIRA